MQQPSVILLFDDMLDTDTSAVNREATDENKSIETTVEATTEVVRSQSTTTTGVDNTIKTSLTQSKAEKESTLKASAQVTSAVQVQTTSRGQTASTPKASLAYTYRKVKPTATSIPASMYNNDEKDDLKSPKTGELCCVKE